MPNPGNAWEVRQKNKRLVFGSGLGSNVSAGNFDGENDDGDEYDSDDIDWFMMMVMVMMIDNCDNDEYHDDGDYCLVVDVD